MRDVLSVTSHIIRIERPKRPSATSVSHLRILLVFPRVLWSFDRLRKTVVSRAPRLRPWVLETVVSKAFRFQSWVLESDVAKEKRRFRPNAKRFSGGSFPKHIRWRWPRNFRLEGKSPIQSSLLETTRRLTR